VPIVSASVFAAVMAAFYFGSVVNPTGHIHGLPVTIVDQDSGAVVDGQRVDVGASLSTALEHSSKVTTRLKLTPGTLQQAQAEMDKGRRLRGARHPSDPHPLGAARSRRVHAWRDASHHRRGVP
jgi:hypothetical protein